MSILKNIKNLNPVDLVKKLVNQHKNLTPEGKRLRYIRVIGWGLPVALIPSLRFAQDSDKSPSLRKELFVRDFSSYSIGTGIYFGALYGAFKAVKSPIIKNLSKNKKMILPEVIATASYCLWSGIIAPKLSKKFNKKAHKNNISDNKNELMPHIKVKPMNQKDINFAHKFKINSATAYNSNVYSRFKI